MNIDLSQFVGEFLQESFEGLDLMESSLLTFTGEAEVVDSIFRVAHSIKGGAGTFGFSEIALFTHGVETLLDKMRHDADFVSEELINLLLEAVDLLRSMLQATQDDNGLDQYLVTDLNRKIEKILGSEVLANVADDDATGALQDEDSSVAKCLWLIDFKPSLEMLKSGNEPVFIFAALAELGVLIVTPNVDNLPEIKDFEADSLYICWHLKLQVAGNDQQKMAEEIQEVFEWVEDFCDLKITSVIEAPTITASVVAASEPMLHLADANNQNSEDSDTEIIDKMINSRSTIGGDVGSVRVDTEKLDELMNRVGELVVTQAMLAQALDSQIKDGYQNLRLEEGLLQLERNTRDLQEGVMRMRMMPISFVFNRFRRLVHDVSNTLNKKVRLEIRGAQTEIDKTVMEKIGDPLTHLIRNALDHGLESPQQRIENGKPEVGTIVLSAYHQNGFVVIDIIDDGRGLDLKKILKKAIALDLISQEQLLSDDEIKALIFRPGFTTADELSELSGRGVGMDVVMRNIESLGGGVSVVSEEGRGSSFSVKVPLTLAIIEGQLVHVDEDVYVLPLVSIIETVFIKTSNIKTIGAHSYFMDYREEYLHLIDLKKFLEKNNDNSDAAANDIFTAKHESILVIITESAGKKVGLVIDALSGQQQFVVKPLETNFKKVQGLIGGTILGDGSVALILDAAGLIAREEQRNNVVPINKEVVL